MAEDENGPQKELDIAKSILEAKRESTSVIASIAFVLSLPGPLLVLMSYFWPGGEVNTILYYNSLPIGMVCNTLAMLWGLFAVRRWKGIAAVVISFLWWLWVFGTLTDSSWGF